MPTKVALEQENYILRKRVKVLTAQIVVRTAERNAARVALNNYNFMETAREIEASYGINLGEEKAKAQGSGT